MHLPQVNIPTKHVFIERMHVRMPTRACERDAMDRMYIRSSPQCASAEVSQLPTFSRLGAQKLRLVTVRSQTSDLTFSSIRRRGVTFDRSKPSKTKRRKKDIRRNGFQVDGHAHEGPGEQISGPRGPFGQFLTPGLKRNVTFCSTTSPSY